MKRLLRILTAGCLAFSLFQPIASAKVYQFEDAGQIPWAATSIEKLYQEGIIKGLTEKSFEPMAPITRAQLAAILAPLINEKVQEKDFPFEDISEKDWYYGPVKKLYSMGMIKGVSETVFDPNRQLTKEAAAVILARTFHYPQSNQALGFDDASQISPSAIEAIKSGVNKGVFKGTNGKFQPKKLITRAEVAVILHLTLFGEPAAYEPPPKPVNKLASRSSDMLNQRLTKAVQSAMGVPYRFGGTSTKGFDCSGFTQYVFKQVGVDLPRDSRSQYSEGSAVSMKEMEKGDLIFFDTGGGEISHVGIYMGNNKMAHAPSSGGSTRVDSIDWYLENYKVVGVRRVIS